VVFVVILIYIVILNKLRFDQIGCSGRSNAHWQCRAPTWYEIVEWLGTPDLDSVVPVCVEVVCQSSRPTA